MADFLLSDDIEIISKAIYKYVRASVQCPVVLLAKMVVVEIGEKHAVRIGIRRDGGHMVVMVSDVLDDYFGLDYYQGQNGNTDILLADPECFSKIMAIIAACSTAAEVIND